MDYEPSKFTRHQLATMAAEESPKRKCGWIAFIAFCAGVVVGWFL